jgi:O-antigen/teichoic acid export membrane protein
MTPAGAVPDESAPLPPDGSEGIARNTFFGLAAQLTSAAFTAVITLYLVRALGPEDYGVFALAVGVGTLVVLASDLGVTQSAERFIAEHRGDRSAVATVMADALKLKLAAAAIACGGLIAAAEPVADAYDIPELTWPLRAAAVAVLGQTILALYRGSFVALARVSVVWRIVLLESVVETAATIAIVVAGAGAAGAAWGRAAGYLFGAAVGMVSAIRFIGPRALSLRAKRPGRKRQIAAYAGPLFLVNAAYTLFDQIDVLLIGAIKSATAVAVFEAPLRLVHFLGYAGQAVAAGVAPRLARGARASPDVAAFERALRWLVLVQAALVAPVLVWATPMVEVALGDGYEDSAEVLRALAPFMFLSAIGTFVTLAVNYLGEARRRIPLAIAAVALNAAIDLVLIPEIGVVGAAVGTDVAFAVYVLGHLWMCRRLLGFAVRPMIVTVARALAASAAMAALLAAFGTSDVPAAALVAGALAGLAVYGASLVLLREISPAELRAARAAMGRLRGR